MLDIDVTPTELEYFDDLVAGLDVAADGQLQITSILDHLTRAHATKSEVIQVNTSILEILIISHACFPFSSPVLLTKDAFCRALLLLTSRCESNFKQATSTAGQQTMRERMEQQRLQFIYSALACPPTGMATHDDIVDIISRVKYPWLVAPKGIVRRRPVSDFFPLAERLEPSKDKTLPDTLPVSNLKPLGKLVAAFPPRWNEAVSDLSFKGSGMLSVEQFVQWATKVCYTLSRAINHINIYKVQLLEALDQLFSVFFQKP